MKGPTYRSEDEEGSGASFESHLIWGEWRAAAEMLQVGDLVKMSKDKDQAAEIALLVGAYLPTYLRLEDCRDGYWAVLLEKPEQPRRYAAGEFKAVAS